MKSACKGVSFLLHTNYIILYEDSANIKKYRYNQCKSTMWYCIEYHYSRNFYYDSKLAHHHKRIFHKIK